MSKFLPDAMLDLLADNLLTYGDRQILCSAEPTTYTGATGATALASCTLATGSAGSYTKADGAIDGRKVTIAGIATAQTAGTAGIGTHIAIVDTVNSILKAVTTCGNFSVETGDEVVFPTWKLTIRDPS
jgi:hypothetical protein